ncbi:Ppx/GppA phosphatase family protein [Cohnella cholangitidis]|uniref:Ppx/GppA family phosphatase n=1 Tax=Cohnella cholangitidis TaxID=2598458 RepID=A0A7G5BUW1_9BACL|nr:Ppx/GppA phosphatase family protein [Cohnella cholangitidis]QMV40745.1 Ppx/GppA family phosphatase [Cohnella cholangitidis]
MHDQANRMTGIIDIGSNTVRLSVYQLTDNGAYRVVDQGRWPARLSQRLDKTGLLPDEAVEELAEVLRHFCRICQKHGADRVRAVATAAIRQAVNRESIIRRLFAMTGLTIEVLSGEDEARIGSQAMLNSLSLSDCFVVDIGGGSTEISLIRNRKVVSAVSFPIGCVNTSAKYALGSGTISSSVLAEIQSEVRRLLSAQKWIAGHPGLPLIGLGGTVRALAKLHQRESNYAFPHLHGYELSIPDLSSALDLLSAIPVDKRRKLPGLSKDRGDVIVPGLAILLGVMQQMLASRLVVCGTGLRDGLFYETCLSGHPTDSEDYVLNESIRNLIALYPVAPAEHLQQVRKLALTVYDRLSPNAKMPPECRRLLDTAARLFRIGTVIDYNDSADHTFYMLLHTHWNGLSHRETILTAAIASYRGTNPLRRKLSPYRSMLAEGDDKLVAKLGSLLQLASALDRSESQAILSLELSIKGSKLHMVADASHPLPVERMEVENIAKELKKNWGITPELTVRVQ